METIRSVFEAHLRHVAVDGGLREPREHRRRDRDDDERRRHGIERVRAVIGRVASDVAAESHSLGAAAGACSNIRQEHRGDHAGDHHEKHPPRRFPCLPQARAPPSEVGAIADAQVVHRPNENQGLHRDARGGDPAEQHDPRRIPFLDASAFGPAENAENAEESHNGHDVVEHGRPHVRAEVLPGVEDLAEHRVHAVKENLGQTPIGEGDGEVEPLALHRGRENLRDERRAQGQQEGHRAEGDDREREQLVEEGLPAVFGLLRRANDRGHQNRVDQAADDDHVNEVRQLVRHGEGVGGRRRDADDRSKEDRRADEPQETRNQAPQEHDEGRACDALGRARLFLGLARALARAGGRRLLTFCRAFADVFAARLSVFPGDRDDGGVLRLSQKSGPVGCVGGIGRCGPGRPFGRPAPGFGWIELLRLADLRAYGNACFFRSVFEVTPGRRWRSMRHSSMVSCERPKGSQRWPSVSFLPLL